MLNESEFDEQFVLVELTLLDVVKELRAIKASRTYQLGQAVERLTAAGWSYYVRDDVVKPGRVRNMMPFGRKAECEEWPDLIQAAAELCPEGDDG